MRRTTTCARVVLVATVTVGSLLPATAGLASTTAVRSAIGRTYTSSSSTTARIAGVEDPTTEIRSTRENRTRNDRYTVQPGDTLTAIAARYGMRGGWPRLYSANRRVIGSDPNLIYPGTALTLPTPSVPHLRRYLVASGDTLTAIAARYRVRGGWPRLYSANRRAIGPNPSLIRPGTVLTVPEPVSSVRNVRHARRLGAPPLGPPAYRHVPRFPLAPDSQRIPMWLMGILFGVGGVILLAFSAAPARAAVARASFGHRDKAGTSIDAAGPQS